MAALFPKGDAVQDSVDFCHIHGPAEGDAQPLALADGVVRDSPVAAQNMAFRIHKIALRGFFSRIALQKTGVVVVLNKADFLAVRLVRHAEPGFLRHAAGLRFGVCAQGHQRMRELVLCQGIEHIALVLAGRGLFQQPAPGAVLLDHRVVPGGDVIIPQQPRLLQHRVEFQVPVACNAGIRRAARRVLPGKILDDVALELLGEIQDQMLDAQLVTHPARVVDVVQGTAAPGGALLHVGVRPQAHGHARHVVAGF